jgi:ketosteroid isomerase-like protein
MSSPATATIALDPKRVVRRYLDALIAGDDLAIRDSFTEDATWIVKNDLPLAGPWIGREVIVSDFLGQMAQRLEPGSIRFEIGPMLVDGNTVVLEWIAHARTRAGERFEDACCGIFEIRDGRIAAVREYLDSRHVGDVLFGESDGQPAAPARRAAP